MTPATEAINVILGSGSKVYDGTKDASNVLVQTVVGGPVGFSADQLGTLTFMTDSKNVGTYTKLSTGPNNPTGYDSDRYAVGYRLDGSYSITPKSLIAAIADKVYDGTTAAVVKANGAIVGDKVGFSYASGTFADKNVGNNLKVDVAGIALSGEDAGNYTFQGGTTLTGTASITPRSVSLNGGKVYDASTNAAAGIFKLGNLVAGEDLNLAGQGSFADPHVGTGKSVALGTLALSNGQAGLASNYQLVDGRADITPATLTISANTNSKVYDGTTGAQARPTVAGLQGTDSVGGLSQRYTDKNAGSGKTIEVAGYTIDDGNGGRNYVVNTVANQQGVIERAALSTTGATAQNKTYDATTAIQIAGGKLVGTVAGDDVQLQGGGTMADANVGKGKAVTAALALNGSDASNYTLTQPTGLTADIMPASNVESARDLVQATVNGASVPALSRSMGQPLALSGSLHVASLAGSTEVAGNLNASAGDEAASPRDSGPRDSNPGSIRSASVAAQSINLLAQGSSNNELQKVLNVLPAELMIVGSSCALPVLRTEPAALTELNSAAHGTQPAGQAVAGLQGGSAGTAADRPHDGVRYGRDHYPLDRASFYIDGKPFATYVTAEALERAKVDKLDIPTAIAAKSPMLPETSAANGAGVRHVAAGGSANAMVRETEPASAQSFEIASNCTLDPTRVAVSGNAPGATSAATSAAGNRLAAVLGYGSAMPNVFDLIGVRVLDRGIRVVGMNGKNE